MLRTRHLWSAAAVLTLSCLSASAQPAPAPPAKPIAATVNTQPIYESALLPGLSRVPAERKAEARVELLNYLIDNSLVDQYLTQFQVKVEKADVDKKVEEIKAEIKRTQNKEFAQFLIDVKLSEADLREQIFNDLRWEKFATAQATDKVLADLFNGNKDLFDGGMVRARHILLTPADAKAADAAVAQLRAIKLEIETAVAAELAKTPTGPDAEKARIKLTDEKFAAKAKELSVCPSGKSAGGDLGLFHRGGDMVEPFARVAFALKPYQMSDAVKTQFGYHLILVTDRKPGTDVKFEDVKTAVKEVYYDKLREAIVEQQHARRRSKLCR